MAHLRLLLVEDDESTQELVARLIQREFPTVDLYLAHSGKDALTFLEVDDMAPGVDLVLLDLNIPLPSGQEVLARLRSREATQSVPVVVLSGSNDPEDHEFCRRHGAAFVMKPVSYDAFADAIRQTLRFWVDTVRWN